MEFSDNSPTLQLIERIQEKHQTSISVREPLSAGKSGAFVAIVDCSGQHDGIFVLKTDSIPSRWENEESRHRKAIADQAFSGCIPDIVLSEATETHYALLLRLAGDSRLLSRPLVASLGLFGSAYAELSRLAVDRKNAEIGERMTLEHVLGECLGHQLDPKDGRIIANTTREFGPDVAAASRVAHQDVVLPNPINLVSLGTTRPIEIRPLLGPFHGDLHGQNIFVRAQPDASVSDIYIIDLASYRSRGLLFFDHAYLELSTLLRQLNQLGDGRWFNLVECLSGNLNTNSLQPEESGWLTEIRRGRRALTSRLEELFPDRKDDLDLQFLVAQVAAGLSFLNKRANDGAGSGGMRPGQYQQAFVWAAVHLRAILQLSGASINDLGSAPAVVPRLGAPQGSGKNAVDFTPLGNFDGAGFNILVIPAGMDASELPDPIRETDWSLVVDFNEDEPRAESMSATARRFRQLWPGEPEPDMKLLTRGGLWYSANGRLDLSDARPAASSAAWRRTYRRPLDRLLAHIADTVSPPAVRVLCIAEGIESDLLRMVCESLDGVFGSDLQPIALAWTKSIKAAPDSIDVLPCLLEALSVAIRIARPPKPLDDADPVLPCREGAAHVLKRAPQSLVDRASRDLTLVYRGKANVFPSGRAFGVDFRRGMRIEWSELAQLVDVPREAMEPLRDRLNEALATSSNRTVNLLHEPSAGGTTLGRRLAWEFMEQYPTVVLDQLSEDTASYLRDVFQFSALPVLVLMESGVITESERERLLDQLREENTRAVFLWVSRIYGHASAEHALTARLSSSEAEHFREVYSETVTDPSRLIALKRLTSDQSASLRNPFFFGLAAFGQDFLGIESLLSDVIGKDKNEIEKSLIADLCLVSLYSNEGFPLSEFNELCERFNGGIWPLAEDSIFLLVTNNHVRVSHALLAERALEGLARNADQWRADLHIHTSNLLDHLRAVRHLSSDRVQRVIQTLFFTRDIGNALQADTDLQSGAIATQRRFSPLLSDIGSVTQSRAVLRRIVSQWPHEAHYGAHLARHLIYEEPREIEEAVDLGLRLERLPEAATDAALTHIVGMIFRIRMQQRLRDALSAQVKFDQVEEAVWSDFEEAHNRFSAAQELDPSTEYGLVATIQLVSSMLTLSAELAGFRNVPDFLHSRERRYIELLSIAEEAIDALTDKPHTRLSFRAEKAMAEWHAVYNNLDRVISDLRALNARHEDTATRRALCVAIVARSQHKWAAIPQADLNTIRLLMERNIGVQGVRDADVRRWLRAYRLTAMFDTMVALDRLTDWHRLSPDRIEPAFYLFVFNSLRWMNGGKTQQGLADEVTRWLQACRANRPFGQRAWSFEWLTKSGRSITVTNFNDLGFDAPGLIRAPTPPGRAMLEARLAPVTGRLRDYRGPQQATLDLGQGLSARLTPLARLTKDDEGKQVSAFLSFSYDGMVGWDPELTTGHRRDK